MLMYCIRCGLLLCLAALLGAEQLPTPELQAEKLEAGHQVFNRILKDIVKDDGVDYRRLQTRHSEQLERYRRQLAEASVPEDEAAEMAFYINAYNALTLALVLEKLPAEQEDWSAWSVRTVRGFWKRYTFDVAGTWMSLDQIEHQTLRPMGDPRVHFAVNCASVSCPPLRSEAYTGRQLETQLKEQTAAFMRSTYHLRLKDGRLSVNPILKWFGSDFKDAGGVAAYLRTHAQRDEIRACLSENSRLSYFSYDWSLNLSAQEDDRKDSSSSRQ